MQDLSKPGIIKFKGLLFLAIGLLSFALLILEHPDLKSTLLLLLTVWSFCRFYYFAFYVIEHYVDPSYRFASLWSFAAYLFKERRIKKGGNKPLE